MTICLLRHSGELLQNGPVELRRRKTDTLLERPARIQLYQFEPARQDFERVLVFHGVCEITLTEMLTTQMGVMRRSKKVSSFELYKFNPLLRHCGSIARELVHCYTWGRLRIVTVGGNTVAVSYTHLTLPTSYAV